MKGRDDTPRISLSTGDGSSDRRSFLDRSKDGASFILDRPASVPAIWGERDQVLQSQGEPLMIVAPTGAGKTTLAGQYVMRRLGCGDPELLGLPVVPDERKGLYVAADRPAQAARSLRRIVNDADRRTLRERLVVWPGPLSFSVLDNPTGLAELCAGKGAGTLVIDSLKDLAPGLAEDSVGAAVNIALQHVVAAGIEVVVLHHLRKGQVGNPKPRSIDDVYGSAWLTAGCGSVVLLWGKPGDAIVELSHLKQPAGEVGPFKVIHDHERGTSTRHQAPDLARLVATAPAGLTVREAAIHLFGTTDPTPNEIEKARRRLKGIGAVPVPGAGPTDPDTFTLRDITREAREGSVSPSVSARNGSRTPHEPPHDGLTPLTTPMDAGSPPLRGKPAKREALPDGTEAEMERQRALVESEAA